MNVTQPNPKSIEINGRRLEFEQTVDEIITLDDRVIFTLLVDDYEDEDPLAARNVLAFDENGEELWRIASSGYFIERKPDIPDSYYELTSENGQLKAHSFHYSYDLDPDTGAVSNAEYHY